MCNITLIDALYGVFSKREVREITTINSLLGNLDGFGYCLFSDHKIVKTKNDALTFWKDNYYNSFDYDFFNGIYHVRKTSVSSSVWIGGVKQEDKNISDDKSHPFNYNDIIVAHNGFLTFRNTHINSEKYQKLIEGDLIDSQKFAIVLSSICENGKVTFENIKEATNLFSGAFCFAIKGVKDNFAWLCRGKDRTLNEMNIFDGQSLVGIVVNTTTTSLDLIGDILADMGYEYSIKELKENTTYKYSLNSFYLEEAGEIMQDSVYEKSPIPERAYTSYSKEYDLTIYEDIYETMYDMGLIISDLILLSEIFMKKPLLILDENELKEFKKYLHKLIDETHKGRLEAWQDLQIYKNGSVYNLYKEIEYPFMLNSKEELKILYEKLKVYYKENRKNELLAI